jgi:hypothetical protein
MSQLGQIISLTTDPAVDFVDAIVDEAMDLESLALDLSVCGTPTARCRITGITLVSTEALDWRLWLWRKAAGAGAGIAADSCIGYWQFVAASAARIASTGLYYYFIFGLDIPYTDEDLPTEKPDPLAPSGRFHLGLQPTSGGKSAGEAGAVKITLFVDPTHG